MPISLQSLNLDRPGLIPLSPDQATVLAPLLGPLQAPYDLTGIAVAIHNLHTGLAELKSSVRGSSNERLAGLISATKLAAGWLGEPAAPPLVTVMDTFTLWNCLIAVDCQAADRKLFKAIGAIYFLLAGGSAPPSQAQLRALLQAALSSRSEFQDVRDSHATAALIACSKLVVKATIQLQTKALSRASAAVDMVEARVEKAWAGAYRFDIPLKTESLPAARGMTPADVVMTAKEVRDGAEAGSSRLLVAGLSHWFGVLPMDMLVMRVFAAGPGLVRIDPTTSFAVLRLSGVLTELARAVLPDVLSAGDDLQMPLPAWISRLLRPLRAAAPGAQSLLELPGLNLSAAELRRLFSELHLPRRITPAKFVIDRAQPLADTQHDQLRRALVNVDFSLIHKVAAAYPHISHAEFLDSLRLRAAQIHWGDLSPSPVPQHGYLSKVTPELKTVTALGQRLLRELQASYPGNHAGIDRLQSHHSAFIRFTAFMLAVALLLRGQEKTLLPASALLLCMLAGFNDKALPSAQTAPAEVCFGQSLRYQFRYLKAHYLALAHRLEQLAGPADAQYLTCAEQLRRLAEGAADMPLLVTIESGHLVPFTHLELVAYLGDAWVGNADAIRHAGVDVLRAAGFSYASREAAMRHAGGAKAIASPSSAWSRDDWYSESDAMQEALFSAIDLVPHGGLIQSLPRTA
jgi:hypothetical protein